MENEEELEFGSPKGENEGKADTAIETASPKRRPKRSLRLSFAYSQSAVDVGLWESIVSKNGKLMPSSISLRLQDSNPQVTRNAVYFKAADALKIASILQNFAFSAMEEDSGKRMEFAREKKAVAAEA
ncbi:MAG: hypothetical protein AABX01_08070 [Candidatus Micrarchaeota archaeon]